MKIKSITDVITNSSSEVFTLKTDKTPEEVYEWLKENVKWAWDDEYEYPFDVPEILTKDSDILQWLTDFRYLYDSTNPDDVKKYKLRHCLNYATHSFWNDEYDFQIKKHGITVRRYWIKFCEDNMTELLTYFPEDFTEERFWKIFNTDEEYFENYLYPGNAWTDTYDNFIEKFINYYEKECPKYIPEWWSIPKELDVQTYIGQIGFSSIEENSIPYECFAKINKTFNGTNWHMG